MNTSDLSELMSMTIADRSKDSSDVATANGLPDDNIGLIATNDDDAANLVSLGYRSNVITEDSQAALLFNNSATIVVIRDNADADAAIAFDWCKKRTNEVVGRIRLHGLGTKYRSLRNWRAAEGNDLAALIAAELDRLRQSNQSKARTKKKSKRPAKGETELDEDSGDSKPVSQSCVQDLLRLAKTAVLFREPSGKYFATIEVKGHHEHHEIRSKSFRMYLTLLYYQEKSKPPSAEAMQSAIGTLEAMAHYEGKLYEVHVRVAADGDTCCLDLGDDTFDVVKVAASGWAIESNSTIRFRRPKGMLALTRPEPGGSLDLLKKFFNVSEDEFPLFLAWLVASMRPTGPYAILNVNGASGSAKSTISAGAHKLIDRNSLLLRNPPKEPRDLAVASYGNWILVFNNLSSLNSWQSDGFCCISTGGGFATRTLYENDEETILVATRPIILNGITDIAERGDLVDRSVFITPPEITGDRRREESEFWTAFEQESGKMLGFLLDCLSNAMRLFPDVKLDEKPRMADFARFGEAVCRGAGMEPGVFMAAYEANRSRANEAVIEDSDVATAVIEFMTRRKSTTPGQWSGTMGELLSEMNGLVDSKFTSKSTWPKSPKKMAGEFKRVTPNLRMLGYEIDFARGKKRTYTIAAPEKEAETPTVSTASTVSLENKAKTGVDVISGSTASRRQSSAEDADGGFVPVGDDDLSDGDVGRRNRSTSKLPWENRGGVAAVDTVDPFPLLSEGGSNGLGDDDPDWEEI